jgi:stage V sporulation protein SpoVS
MATPLASRDRLAARVGEAIETPEEIALADEVLAEASALVRHYGRAWPDPETAPAVATSIAVAAAARGYLNPSGFQMERSDMATFNRTDENAAGCALTRAEIAALKEYNLSGGIVSIGFVNPDRPMPRSGRNAIDLGWVQVNDGIGDKSFPWGVY